MPQLLADLVVRRERRERWDGELQEGRFQILDKCLCMTVTFARTHGGGEILAPYSRLHTPTSPLLGARVLALLRSQ